jgi:hypothetical protein
MPTQFFAPEEEGDKPIGIKGIQRRWDYPSCPLLPIIRIK